MLKQVKNALVLLLAFFALIVAMGVFTNAWPSLQGADPLAFALAALLFLASIAVWLFSWSVLIKNRTTGSLETSLIGFSCVFAALTPVQVGADALRSLKLREAAGTSLSESISSSMVIKGLKFLLIALVAGFAFLSMFFSSGLAQWLKAVLLSGFAVVLLAALLFLLPFYGRAGVGIAELFRRLSGLFGPFARLSEYFEKYSLYVKRIPGKTLAGVAFLAFLSLLLEFLAFFFSFASAGIAIPLLSALALFSLFSILERTPFLPRGIGVVEAVGFFFLSTEGLASVQLGLAEIATVIIIFDCVRLVIPTVASLVAFSFLFPKRKRLNQVQALE